MKVKKKLKLKKLEDIVNHPNAYIDSHNIYHFIHTNIIIQEKMFEYFGKEYFVNIEENDDRLFIKGWYFLKEWFEDDDFIFIEKMFDDLIKDLI